MGTRGNGNKLSDAIETSRLTEYEYYVPRSSMKTHTQRVRCAINLQSFGWLQSLFTASKFIFFCDVIFEWGAGYNVPNIPFSVLLHPNIS